MLNFCLAFNLESSRQQSALLGRIKCAQCYLIRKITKLVLQPDTGGSILPLYTGSKVPFHHISMDDTSYKKVLCKIISSQSEM